MSEIIAIVDSLKCLIVILGTRSYEHSIDYLVWSHCYLEYAYDAPAFYPEEFDRVASAVFHQFNMNRKDIDVSNARSVYLHLRNVLSQF